MSSPSVRVCETEGFPNLENTPTRRRLVHVRDQTVVGVVRVRSGKCVTVADGPGRNTGIQNRLVTCVV